jgi:hypothetical protein
MANPPSSHCMSEAYSHSLEQTDGGAGGGITGGVEGGGRPVGAAVGPVVGAMVPCGTSGGDAGGRGGGGLGGHAYVKCSILAAAVLSVSVHATTSAAPPGALKSPPPATPQHTWGIR